MDWTDETTIETPERIDLDLELAGLGSRFVAQLLDWLIKGLATFVLLLLAIIILMAAGVTKSLAELSHWVQAGLVVALYLIWLAYDIYFEGWRFGQTPGKKWCGIRVVKDSGAPIDVSAAAMRNFLALADMLPFFYLLGALLVQTGRRKQRLGDLAAGTIVIRERMAAAPDESDGLIARFAVADIVFTRMQMTKCRPGDPEVLRSFLQRLEQLKPRERDNLARSLAQQFADRIGYDLPISDVVGFLASLYRDLQSERGRRY